MSMRLPIWFAAATCLKALHISDSDQTFNLVNCNAHSVQSLSTPKFRHKITEVISRFKERSGCPGIAAAISYSGNMVYCAGLGYADVERLVPVCPDTVFRIASISKSLTSLLVGRLMEQGKIVLDEDVRSYVPEFPPKECNGSYARITVRSLLDHTSGIRNYNKSDQANHWPEYPEMLLQTHYDSPIEACKLFENDDLLHLPGQKYSYSTYAFTLLSAVVERVCASTSPAFDGIIVTKTARLREGDNRSTVPVQCQIDRQLECLFSRLGLRNTFLDYNERIIPMRTTQYRRDSKGVLKNTPMVDNSYKWAGGGILSTAPDLILLANQLSSIYLGRHSSPGLVKRETLKQLWTVSATNPESRWQPALGWFVARRSGNPVDQQPVCPDRLYVGHSGGAVGGTTMLLMSLPCCSNHSVEPNPQDPVSLSSRLPSICVVVLTNLEDASGISDLAISLAELVTDHVVQQSQTDSANYVACNFFASQPVAA